MSVLDQVAVMQAKGMNQDQIVGQLRNQGVPESDIANAVSQGQIKQAVSGAGAGDNIFNQAPSAPVDFMNPLPPTQFGTAGLPQYGTELRQSDTPLQPPAAISQLGSPQTIGGGMYSSQPQNQEPFGAYSAGGDPYSAGQEGIGEYAGMQASMISPQQQPESYPAEPVLGNQGEYPSYGGYPSYQPYQDALSTDMITEISEQIVNEKLSSLQGKIEKILDMRTVVEANMTNLNDRLKRMEKIVDQMQVSILKKVGEYMTDIADVKKELEETQKSFVAIEKKKRHRR